MKQKFIWLGLPTGITLALVGLLTFKQAGGGGTDLPSDSQLLALFYQHRSSIAELQRMVMEDSSHESYFSKTDLDTKINGERRKRYEKLFSYINKDLVIGVDYDGTIRFIIAGDGLSAIGPGWLKGIEYVPGDAKRKGILLKSLDSAPMLPADVYLKKIERNWFLIYQRDE